MKDNRLTLKLNEISIHELTQYLESTDWIKDGSIGKKATIWHRPEEEYSDFEIIQPIDSNIKGYLNKLSEVIESISDFEDKTTLTILEELQTFCTDLVKVRVIHQDVENGTIPLNDGVLLIGKSKELMVASVLSTFNKKKYFSGSRSSDVQNYLSQLRLGQTEVGSFVVNLLCPINKSIALQDDADITSLTRSITTNLSKSLDAINVAVKRYKRDSNIFHFEEAVTAGVSANLCDALIGLSGSSKLRNFEISIALARVEPDKQNVSIHHSFNSEHVSVLEAASEYYKGNYVMDSFIASGLVNQMKHSKDEDFGEISIRTPVHNVEKNITVQLTLDDYWSAVHAHESGSYVSCTGQLIVTPKTARLIEAYDFTVNGNKDLFD